MRQKIGEAFEEWLGIQEAAGLYAENTILNYRIACRKFIDDQGDLEVGEVRRSHAKAWMGSFGGLAGSTIRVRLSAMSSFYSEMVYDDKLETNPFAGLRRPKARRKKIRRAAPPAATQRLLETARPRERTMIALAVYLGLRRFEIAQVRVRDFDFESMTLSLIGKGSKEATLPVSPAAHDAVVAWIEFAGLSADDWFFAGRGGGHLCYSQVGRVMTRAAVEAGTKITPHQYRHRAGTDVARHSGIKMGQLFLRHESSSTTDDYLAIEIDELRAPLAEIYPSAA